MARITAKGKTNHLFIFKLECVSFYRCPEQPQLSRKVMVDASFLYGKGAVIGEALKKDSI